MKFLHGPIRKHKLKNFSTNHTSMQEAKKTVQTKKKKVLKAHQKKKNQSYQTV